MWWPNHAWVRAKVANGEGKNWLCSHLIETLVVEIDKTDLKWHKHAVDMYTPSGQSMAVHSWKYNASHQSRRRRRRRRRRKTDAVKYTLLDTESKQDQYKREYNNRYCIGVTSARRHHTAVTVTRIYCIKHIADCKQHMCWHRHILFKNNRNSINTTNPACHRVMIIQINSKLATPGATVEPRRHISKLSQFFYFFLCWFCCFFHILIFCSDTRQFHIKNYME